ncbi:MAG: rhomboid family intramembrane serine protease [Lachnospiraceae bacterium]
MTSKISKMLINFGFLPLKVMPAEAEAFYNETDTVLHLIVLIDYHQGFLLTGQQVSGMQKKLENNLKKDSEVLFIFCAEHWNNIREICSTNDNIWVIDRITNQLLIYENQPGDFCNLRSKLEAILEQDEKKTIWNIGKNHPEIARSIITFSLVAINIIVWLILEVIGDTTDATFMLKHGAMFPPAVIALHEWYRFFTSMFLHFGAQHLINNMLILTVLGMRLEPEIGRVRFLFLYILSGLSGSFLSYTMMLQNSQFAVSAGASGAIFGVIGGLIIVAIRNRGRFKGMSIRGLVLMAALILYFGFTSSGVDNWAHIGGLIGGLIITSLYSIPFFRKTLFDE